MLAWPIFLHLSSPSTFTLAPLPPWLHLSLSAMPSETRTNGYQLPLSTSNLMLEESCAKCNHCISDNRAWDNVHMHNQLPNGKLHWTHSVPFMSANRMDLPLVQWHCWIIKACEVCDSCALGRIVLQKKQNSLLLGV